jgi:hypothetical protein
MLSEFGAFFGMYNDVKNFFVMAPVLANIGADLLSAYPVPETASLLSRLLDE